MRFEIGAQARAGDASARGIVEGEHAVVHTARDNMNRRTSEFIVKCIGGFRVCGVKHVKT